MQIRILRTVQENEARRQEDTDRIIESLMRSGAISPDYVAPPPLYSSTIAGGTDNALQLSGVGTKEKISNIVKLPPPLLSPQYQAATTTTTPGNVLSLTPAPTASPSKLHPTVVMPTLCSLHDKQNTRDAARDLADLRNSMREAMHTGSDTELAAVLQVSREELPEVLKTLQRALEQIIEREASVTTSVEGEKSEVVVVVGGVVPNGEDQAGKHTKPVVVSTNSRSWGGNGNDGWSRDTLDREFIETGIDALGRINVGVDPASLPSWTITR